jgi:hypothetical protein
VLVNQTLFFDFIQNIVGFQIERVGFVQIFDSVVFLRLRKNYQSRLGKLTNVRQTLCIFVDQCHEVVAQRYVRTLYFNEIVQLDCYRMVNVEFVFGTFVVVAQFAQCFANKTVDVCRVKIIFECFTFTQRLFVFANCFFVVTLSRMGT